MIRPPPCPRNRNPFSSLFVAGYSLWSDVIKMDGFDGGNGNDWGMPNISSVQDWDNGPEGVQRPISE